MYFLCTRLRNSSRSVFLVTADFGYRNCILALYNLRRFAALGFIKYNGMTLEKFIVAFVKSEILTPKKLVYKSENTYYNLMKSDIDKKVKEEYKR